MLKKRMMTAVIGLPLLVLAILFLPPTAFTLLIGFLMLFAGWEWSLLSGVRKKSRRIFYVLFIFIGLFMSVFISTVLFLWMALLAWLWIFAAIVQYERDQKPLGFQSSWVRGLTGFFIIIAAWGAIVILRANPNFGSGWLLALLAIVFSADTGAYFAGRLFGKKHLSPRVSPNKTWEGFFGGLALAMVVSAVSGGFLVTNVKQYSAFIAVSFVTAIFSVVGDLGVSLQKRIAHVKDSGVMFPGHGGLLDRLDSIASASVVFLFGVLWLGL